MRQNPALGEGLRSRRPHSRVIAFPVFDRYGDQIRDWLAAIEAQKRGTCTPARVARSIRRTAADVGRIRNSLRHSNLASFLRHAANALDASERDGARYILMTALALPGFAFRDPGLPFKDEATPDPAFR